MKNIVNERTCFKSINIPSCIDLFLTNCSNSFQNTIDISPGMLDFHKMIVTVMKKTFPKALSKISFTETIRILMKQFSEKI